MKWTEVTVSTSNEAVEAVSNILMEAGASGVKIDDALDYQNLKPDRYGEIIDLDTIPHVTSGAQVSAYYPETVFVPEILPTIKQRVSQLSDFGLNPAPNEVSMTALSDEDWATAWKKYYHPVRVTRYLTIVPSWEDYQPAQSGELVLRLDPGRAFGTGTHPTTKLCLQALETVINGGEHLIDVGTGSGVLSIAAKAMGVGAVEAYDLDDVAVASAQTNLDLNPVAKDVKVAANDLLAGIDTQADIIVANILAEIIIPLVPQARQNLKRGGYFITSGIIDDKFQTVLTALTDAGFQIAQHTQMGDWHGIVAYLPTDED
ncbi:MULTISPECIES: 50S ribosomal protein L11 methyltransferase [Lactiplantibacillus]|jgi:ribosomal protein L11 methyltransferase|uniref:Ribosomal protein L11 methyltransferase n=3 Tax=Lactiplantibacillus pentosus TaxID=1589 RepID=A0A241RTY7_LACPE|nr:MULTISPECIES: 50S ribosomal protein L11 methyltransferase [Lactiplantibacillus]MCH4130452.1 50S ribosomal protein L11 methyltransferase [Lactiplantibacillus sp.]BBM23258.1 ribosomal protein L11 methyltransferase [Lactiplantibacillus plantarum]ASG81138.1 50S ribosomal protein L11 methyltransferase [Lactiplantibacillus pentosus]AYG37575.1 50S ribosomal protein L11 methyltransferase [Lactiplantibacillus pentosus]AYG40232.1 50S ribosomal protein L11 methyltransferase [Lactiplantibacillus pentos